MSATNDILNIQLQQACKQVGARWAVWLRHSGISWEFGPQVALNRTRQKALADFIANPKTSAWLAGAFGSGRTRFTAVGDLEEKLGTLRVYSFVNTASRSLLLVGTDELSREAQGLFRILALQDDRPAAHRDDMDLIHQITLRVVGLTDIEVIAQTAAELMAEKFGYEFVEVLLPDEHNENLLHLGMAGKMAYILPPQVRWEPCPVEKGLTGRVFRHAERVIQNQVQTDPDYYSLTDWHAASELCVPLREGDQVVGLINLESGVANAFSADDVFVIETLAGILTPVIVNANHLKELQERTTSQQIAEDRLIQSTKLAALGEMAAGVAHELNNPLTTVSGFIQLVLDELPEDAPWRDDLKMVLGEAKRAHRVVRRLLDFSRQSDNTRWEISLNELVESAVGLMQHQAQSGGIEVEVTLAHGLPQIWVDPIQIKEVLINLLQNALQAMPEGGRLAVVTGRRRSSRRDGVMFSVTDNGEGIPLENLDRIYEPFFTTRPIGKGTGLGLAVSYGIISDHGGRIDVTSQVGEGSCFTVWLPAAPKKKPSDGVEAGQ